MWSAGSERRKAGRSDIYLSDCEVAVVNAEGALWHVEAESTVTALQALASHLQEATPKRVRVWLGAALCRAVRITPVSGEVSRRERVRVAETAAVRSSGLSPPCRVELDVAGTDGETLAVVVEEAVLTSIEQTLRESGLRAGAIQPWWAYVLRLTLNARPTLRALAVIEHKATTILVGEQRRFSSVQVLWPTESADAVSSAFTRSLISGMIPQDDALGIRLDWTTADEKDAHAFVESDALFGNWARIEGAMI